MNGQDGIALFSATHPRGAPLKRGRPTKKVAVRRAAAVENVEIEISDLPHGLTLKRQPEKV